ncbi:sulfatase [Cellulophaga lytica DSM 7489]|uniref:Sulfatase n=1 Tax=Cellulophaga lytica (strain ATCC 23178 / DSM 7489 / JCM 8516 / NBRC 14961 / NCIMB 1423 / VKM B-1433 / Cy l20) TaxID=867900 RepID=F0RGT3_CELLC|nr:sulfatase [Cellulophaga lytica]ADY29112.1 sulfatase [Cellulophaga lytica DSM 7489]WQG76716.1 sulfatase [Cellulophaga lytica]
MFKKEFYIVVLLVFAIGCKQKKSPEKQTKKRPNIIYIMSDDHAVQAISAYNHPISKLAPTPNIDKIATEGAIFNGSYVTNSICGPSRAVILTGKHSHINGFRQNGDHFDGNQETLPKILKKEGYQTALMGKWHLHDYPQGFDDWKILVDQGNYYNPDFIINGDTTRVQGYATDLITADAINWLKNKRKDSVPFFLMVQHKAPHRNWMPALRHLNKYDSVSFTLPTSYFPEFNNQKASRAQLQTIYNDMYEGHDLKLSTGINKTKLAHNPWTTDFDRMTETQRATWDSAYLAKNNAFYEADLSNEEIAIWKGQRYLQDYMATIAAVDEGVGEILNYLKTNNLDENTIVVYTSDQGFYMGENGWFDKRFMYEDSFRTPLLIKYPKAIQPGTQINALVQNLDYAPTILDFVGIPNKAKDMQGVSFKGLLNGSVNESDFRDAIYYHYYDYPAFHMVKKHYGIRTKRYKLIHFYDDIDSWEFYDLETDPKEQNNQINNAAYTKEIKLMHTKLKQLQKEYKITNKEFTKAKKEDVDKAYKQFKKLRGTPIN